MALDPIQRSDLMADIASTLIGADPTAIAALGASAPDWLAKGIRLNGAALMADGLPLLSRHREADEYDAGLHEGFAAWLELRGWYATPGERGDLVLLPVPAVAIAIERLTAAWFPQPAIPPFEPGGCPF